MLYSSARAVGHGMADFAIPASHRTIPAWKRMWDCVMAVVLLITMSPVIVLAMVLVKLTSRGPAIYSQTRLGLNRQPFTMYKIRTMTHNCEAHTGACWAPRTDPRQTRIGRILRATHVDELPQLWNILRGEMSLVGPRPERPEIIEQIEPMVPGYGIRLTVLPGMTGLAQVQLPPELTIDDVRRKLRYDVQYAAHFSFWLDLRLMISTATKIVGIPFVVPRSLLRIPGAVEVEGIDPIIRKLPSDHFRSPD